MAEPPVPTPPDRLLRERVRRVFAHLPKALAGKEDAIHQLRVTSRRLRVALPALAGNPDGRRARRALRVLRQVTRTAGSGRDVDVMTARFEESLVTAPREDAGLAVLQRRLRAARTRGHNRMTEALLDLEIAGLRRDLRSLLTRATTTFVAAARLREVRESLGAEIVVGFEELAGAFDPLRLHRLRIRVRRLRYVAEIQDALEARDSGAPALFKELQEALGHVHDEWMLAQWLARQAAAAERSLNLPLAATARAEQKRFLEAAQAAHLAVLERAPADAVRRGLELMRDVRPAA